MNGNFRHVLVATDGSVMADKAIEMARRLGAGGRVTALLVVHDYGLADYLRAAVAGRPDAQQLRDALVAEGRRELHTALARAAHSDAVVEPRVVLSDRSPCREIVDQAAREGCDLIVVASHGLGGRTAGMTGSQSQGVLALASVPVLVVR